MKILITGCNGFLGKEFSEYFSDHELILTNRQNLDLNNSNAVDSFFENNKIDVVLHTAVEGGRRTQVDSFSTMCKNLTMFGNLAKHCNKYGLMINFGSGAEFDRRRNIVKASEMELSDSHPVDYYGLSKRIITEEIYRSKNIFNLRLFGCFGFHEAPNRFIKASLNRLKQGDKILIHENKFMDFFFVEDLCRIVEYYINMEHTWFRLHKDVNMCYKEKISLYEIAELICVITEKDPLKNIKIQMLNNSKIMSYTGSGVRLKSLGVNLIGLRGGIERVYERIRQS
tara:strand:+ start:931 stop:1782 length:852 start_codon:yes stop_codon:yes gene_type:complete